MTLQFLRTICVLVVIATITGCKDKVDKENLQKTLDTEKMRTLLAPVMKHKELTLVALCEDGANISPETEALLKSISQKTGKEEGFVRYKYSEEIRILRNHLATDVNMRFVDRSRFEAVKKEHQFQLSDWSDDRKSALIGKALNADTIISFELLGCDAFDASYNHLTLEFSVHFLNINTLESVCINKTITESGYGSEFDYQDNKKIRLFLGIGVNKLPVSVVFDGIKKSSVSYTAAQLDYVCPFIMPKNTKKIEPDDALSKQLSLIERMEFYPEDKSCSIYYADGSLETASLKVEYDGAEPVLVPHLPEELLLGVVLGGLEFGYSYNVKDGRMQEAYHTSGKIGTLRIRSASLNLSGDMFLNGYQFVIDYMAENDDGTGNQYYACFLTE